MSSPNDNTSSHARARYDNLAARRRQLSSGPLGGENRRSQMKFKQLNIVILLCIIVSCNDENIISNGGLPSGRATLSSKIINNRIFGFSFAKGDTVVVSNASSIKSDILTLVQMNEQGVILGVFMGASTTRPTFRLVYESTFTDSAKIYFQKLKEFSDSTYSTLAIPVKSNQVWIVKTHDDKFAKMNIVNTLAYTDSSTPSAPTPYGEATFDWVYQPSGERKF